MHGRLTALVATIFIVLCGIAAPTTVAATRQRLTVFAASSLTDVFPAIDKQASFSFAGSNELATQIENGAVPDVFASANTSFASRLHAAGLVERPVDFTGNELVVVVPKSNPAGIHTIADLARPGVSVDLANASVPAGNYTRKALRRLRLGPRILRNVVSEETDARAVLSHVALGEVDAGFVYSTDAKTVASRVRMLELPRSAQPRVAYAVAVVTRSSHQAAARAFIATLLGKRGQAKLRAYGFVPAASS